MLRGVNFRAPSSARAAPDRAPKMLLTQDKMQLLQALGVDCVVIQQFDLAFAAIPAEDFVRKYLRERLRAKKVWVGKDLRFGKGRGGDIENLRAWGPKSDMKWALSIRSWWLASASVVHGFRTTQRWRCRRGAADVCEILFRFRQGRVRSPARPRNRFSHGQYRQPGGDYPA